VQRWLKLSNYLQEQGLQVHLIVPRPNDASYFVFDKSLEKDIHPGIKIYPTKTIEPFGLYKKIFGGDKIPAAGFSNVDTTSFKQKLSIFIRTNFFIPDPRKFWKYFAYKQAKSIIEKEGIKTVITSSPPHSVQLIGAKLKRNFDINWIADLRDLWTDIYYYPVLQHSKLSAYIDKKHELKVLKNADKVVTVSPFFEDLFASKSNRIDRTKFTFIPNGFDEKDFSKFKYDKKSSFTICYTGTLSKEYRIQPFLKALSKLVTEAISVKLRFVGVVYQELEKELSSLNLIDSTEFIGYVPHNESISYLEDAYALLLVGPLNESNTEGSIPAKVFEYMAASRPIIYIGKPDGFMAKMLSETNSGSSFGDDENAIYDRLKELYQNYTQHVFPSRINESIRKYSRQKQADQYAKLIV
jgi:glycosyltransferase involved in cell wall biosynthesis